MSSWFYCTNGTHNQHFVSHERFHIKRCTSSQTHPFCQSDGFDLLAKLILAKIVIWQLSLLFGSKGLIWVGYGLIWVGFDMNCVWNYINLTYDSYIDSISYWCFDMVPKHQLQEMVKPLVVQGPSCGKAQLCPPALVRSHCLWINDVNYFKLSMNIFKSHESPHSNCPEEFVLSPQTWKPPRTSNKWSARSHRFARNALTALLRQAGSSCTWWSPKVCFINHVLLDKIKWNLKKMLLTNLFPETALDMVLSLSLVGYCPLFLCA